MRRLICVFVVRIPKVWDGITLAAATKNKLKTKQNKKKKKKKNTNFGTDCLRNIDFAKVTATDMTVITNLSFYDRKDFLWTALLIYFPPSVHVCTLSFDDALRYMYYTAQLNFTCCTWNYQVFSWQGWAYYHNGNPFGFFNIKIYSGKINNYMKILCRNYNFFFEN